MAEPVRRFAQRIVAWRGAALLGVCEALLACARTKAAWPGRLRQLLVVQAFHRQFSSSSISSGRLGFYRAAVFVFLSSAPFAPSARPHELISTEITWAREIARIFDQRCLSCHHQGGAAFDLTTYERARPWAKAIKEETSQRRMPPWGAVKGFADYVEEGALTQEEVNLIAQWVEGGAPEGELRELPDFQWRDRDPAPHVRVDGALAVEENPTVLDKPKRVIGIRPAKLADGATLRVVARTPTGAVEPLIWFDAFLQKFRHDYYLRRPLLLPAGTRIELNADDSGAIERLTGPAEEDPRPARDEHAAHAAHRSEIDGDIQLDSEDLQALLASGESAGLFVCPMDPDVRGDEPGKCSRCGMDLVLGIPKRLEYRVDLDTNPRVNLPGKEIELAFDIRHPETDEPLYHFRTVHEKLLHMFIVSDDLEYFLHEHPVLGPDGIFRFKTKFPRAGLYRVVADFYPEGSAPQLAAKTALVSEKPGDIGLRPAALEPDLSAKVTENLEVELRTEPVAPIAGLKTLMFFQLAPADGMEQYLGAWGHMLAASEDTIDLIHNHPFLAYEDDGRVQFNMIFPRAGVYRVWVQFQRMGVVNTAVFDVPVVELR